MKTWRTRLLLPVCILGFNLSCLAGAQPFPVSGSDLFSAQKVEITAKDKKGVVVVFLSATCPCSNSHIPELTTLAKSFPDFSFVAVHSNANESVDAAKAYFKTAKLPFPVLQDQGSKLADQFKALKTPHAFILLPTGDVVYQGGVSNSADFSHADKRFLKEALQDIEDHKSVREAQGRTLGCIIKRG